MADVDRVVCMRVLVMMMISPISYFSSEPNGGVGVKVENGKAQAANFPFCTIEPNVGIVAVPDPRLHVLSDLSKSQRAVPASIEFVDIAGLVKGEPVKWRTRKQNGKGEDKKRKKKENRRGRERAILFIFFSFLFILSAQGRRLLCFSRACLSLHCWKKRKKK